MENDDLLLRSVEIRDALTLYHWGHDPIYVKWARLASYPTLQAAVNGARVLARRPESYAIVLKKSMKMIGLIELYHRTSCPKASEVGFLLDRAYWQKGYMTQALTLILCRAFQEMNQQEVWAVTLRENERAQKLLEKMGFELKYDVDYEQISPQLPFDEFNFLLKASDWHGTHCKKKKPC